MNQVCEKHATTETFGVKTCNRTPFGSNEDGTQSQQRGMEKNFIEKTEEITLTNTRGNPKDPQDEGQKRYIWGEGSIGWERNVGGENNLSG